MTPPSPLSFKNKLQKLLRTPPAGVVAGIGLLTLMTVLRNALYPIGRPQTDYAFLLYLTATLVIGWRWGRDAALATSALSVGFLIALLAPQGAPQLLIGIPLFVLVDGLFLFLLDREQATRARLEAQTGALARERDRLTRAQEEAAAEQKRARVVSDEQRRVLKALQRETLVPSAPRIPGVSFGFAYAPATAAALVGGDFFNVFHLGPTRAALVLGDVTGKGAEAAALGVVLANMLRAFFTQSGSPAEVVSRVNAAVVESPDLGLMATLFACVIDGNARTIVYVNAGQEQPCLVGPWGDVTRLETTGMAVGSFADSEYEEKTLTVERGRTLVAFTDGLTEIRLPSGSWMNPDLVYAQLSETGGTPPGEVARGLVTWARETAGGALRDDAAVVAVTFD